MAPLTTQTKIGLTFGQIIAITTIFISFGTAWMSMNVRMGNVEVTQQQMKEADRNRDNSIYNFMKENREDHILISTKMDKLYELELDKRKL